MGDAAPQPHVSYAAYVQSEKSTPTRHEWLEGAIYDMAGGTPDHAGLQAAVASELRTLLRGQRRRVFGPDLRIRVLATGLSTYPDAAYDRGEKFAHYRRIPSLKEYVLISQLEPHIEVYRKNAAGKWELAEEAHTGESVPLASVGRSLSVDDVYADPLSP